MATDFYQLLGVNRNVSPEELKKAYRRRARELHPDANPGDAAAEEEFKAVSRAYEVLSDPETKARYDQYGEAGISGGGGRGGDPFAGAGGGLGDIFDAFFGGSSPFGGGGRGGPSGPPRGQDQEVVVDLAFEQAVFGAKVPVALRTAVRCETCAGTGAGEGTKPVTCVQCAGVGQTRQVRQSLLGQMVTMAPCQRCRGMGQIVVTPCSACSGDGRLIDERTYHIDVPPGVDTGATLRLTGRGAVGANGGGAGDLYVHLRVAPHDRYHRDGDELITDVPISMVQAALGVTVTLSTLDGDEDLVVPAGTQPGRVFVLPRRGVPRLQGRGRGDLKAVIVVKVPTKLTGSEDELLRRLAAERGEDVNPPDKGLFSRIKSAFS